MQYIVTFLNIVNENTTVYCIILTDAIFGFKYVLINVEITIKLIL